MWLLFYLLVFDLVSRQLLIGVTASMTLTLSGIVVSILVNVRRGFSSDGRKLWQQSFDDNLHLPLDLLIQACQTLKGDPQREAEQRLIAALNSERAAEYKQLSERNRRGLFALAKIWYDDLDLAFLKMGEQYGGGEMIAPVRSILTFYTGTTQIGAKSVRREEVRIAAEQCLRVLEARVEAAKREEELLRPSQVPDRPTELLHPVNETPNEENRVQLLRASVGDVPE